MNSRGHTNDKARGTLPRALFFTLLLSAATGDEGEILLKRPVGAGQVDGVGAVVYCRGFGRVSNPQHFASEAADRHRLIGRKIPETADDLIEHGEQLVRAIARTVSRMGHCDSLLSEGCQGGGCLPAPRRPLRFDTPAL
jgi:hypothetical protein